MRSMVGGLIRRRTLVWGLFFLFVSSSSLSNAFDNASSHSYLVSLEESIFANVIRNISSLKTRAYIEKRVAYNIKYFTSKGRLTFQQWLNSSVSYLPLVKNILREEGLPEDLALLPLIESGFNVHARSPRKAVGLWQFRASTAIHYGLKINKWVDERKDPVKSTRAAAQYLKDLYDAFGAWPLALASYNAGRGRVMKALMRSDASTFWDLCHNRTLKRETRNYVPRLMAAIIIMKDPELFGFVIPEDPPVLFDEVTVPGGMALNTIAEVAGIRYGSLKKLNPQLKTNLTPLDESSYILRFPAGFGKIFVENFHSLPSEEKMVYREYRIKRGDTVYEISRKYMVDIKDIKRVNRLDRRYRIIAGKTLFIPAGISSSESVRLISSFHERKETL